MASLDYSIRNDGSKGENEKSAAAGKAYAVPAAAEPQKEIASFSKNSLLLAEDKGTL